MQPPTCVDDLLWLNIMDNVITITQRQDELIIQRLE